MALLRNEYLREIERLELEREVARSRRREAYLLACSNSNFDFYALALFLVVALFAVVGGSLLVFSGYPEAQSLLQDWWLGIAEILMGVFFAVVVLMMSRRLVRHRYGE